MTNFMHYFLAAMVLVLGLVLWNHFRLDHFPLDRLVTYITTPSAVGSLPWEKASTPTPTFPCDPKVALTEACLLAQESKCGANGARDDAICGRGIFALIPK
jgi:hypothetical protein